MIANTNHMYISASQHAQMLVVRKEGKAHAQYNLFRSAFELLEAVGREPADCFEEDENDLLPLQKLEMSMRKRMQRQIDELKADMQQRIEHLLQKDITQQQHIEELLQKDITHQQHIDMQQQQIEKLNQQVDMQQKQIDELKENNTIAVI